MPIKAKQKTNPNLHLEQSIINLVALRENYRRTFKRLVDRIRGTKKYLVIKKEKVRLVNLLLGGVTKVNVGHLESENHIPTDMSNVIYLVWPDVETMTMIANQINTARTHVAPENRSYHIIVIPNLNFRCRQVLENEQLIGKVEITPFEMDLIPLDSDVVTCGLPHLIKSCVIDRDDQPLDQMARSLLKLQVLFGRFGKICGKGPLSNTIIRLMNRFQHENAKVYSPIHDQPTEIDQLILIDRLSDPISVLATQRTYEGMLDEQEGICFTQIDINADLLGSDPAPWIGSKVRDGKKKVTLNSSDPIFKECRNLNHEKQFSPWSKKAIKALQDHQGHVLQLTKDLGAFKKFGGLQEVMEISFTKFMLGAHVNIAQYLGKRTTKHMPWKRRAALELELLACQPPSEDPEEYILEQIALDQDFYTVVRIMCLTSLARGGLKKFDTIRKDILQTYGYSHLITLENIRKAGLIKLSEGFFNRAISKKEVKFDYQQLNKALTLFHELEGQDWEDMDRCQLRDLNTIGSGYAPLSAKLVERLHQDKVQPEWFLEQISRALPGEYYPNPRVQQKETLPSPPKQPGQPRKVVVCFVGGVTFAEISAIRLLQRRNPDDYQFLILTSSITNGKKFIDEFVNETATKLDDMLEKKDIL